MNVIVRARDNQLTRGRRRLWYIKDLGKVETRLLKVLINGHHICTAEPQGQSSRGRVNHQPCPV
jgi:hypothetical protein